MGNGRREELSEAQRAMLEVDFEAFNRERVQRENLHRPTLQDIFGSSLSSWLVDVVREKIVSPYFFDVVVAVGMVGRLFVDKDNEGKVSPVQRAVDWVGSLEAELIEELTRTALREVQKLEDRLSLLPDCQSDDDRSGLLLDVLILRDDLESAIWILRKSGKAQFSYLLDGALTQIDSRYSSRAADFAGARDSEHFERYENRLSVVARQEPSAWWVKVVTV